MPAQSLLSENITDKLRVVVQALFNGNRILDRIMDNLAVPLVMTNTEKILHVPLAHAYPLLADEVVDYMHGRNQMSGYLATIEDLTVYQSPLEAFQKYLDFQIELEDLIQEALNVAMEESDMTTKKFLDKFLLEISVYTNQALLLVDKATMYGNNTFAWMMMDNNAKELLIPELRPSEEGED